MTDGGSCRLEQEARKKRTPINAAVHTALIILHLLLSTLILHVQAPVSQGKNIPGALRRSESPRSHGHALVAPGVGLAGATGKIRLLGREKDTLRGFRALRSHGTGRGHESSTLGGRGRSGRPLSCGLQSVSVGLKDKREHCRVLYHAGHFVGASWELRFCPQTDITGVYVNRPGSLKKASNSAT